MKTVIRSVPLLGETRLAIPFWSTKQYLEIFPQLKYFWNPHESEHKDYRHWTFLHWQLVFRYKSIWVPGWHQWMYLHGHNCPHGCTLLYRTVRTRSSKRQNSSLWYQFARRVVLSAAKTLSKLNITACLSGVLKRWQMILHRNLLFRKHAKMKGNKIHVFINRLMVLGLKIFFTCHQAEIAHVNFFSHLR